MFFFQDCGDFRGYFLIKDCKYCSFTLFFICFAFVHPYSVDVVEAAPPGAAEDHWSCWDMQAQGHQFCCTWICSSREYNGCETFFLQCSSLERASRSLAKTGLFFCFLGTFFRVRFRFVFMGPLKGPVGGSGVDFGAIWGAFGGHFYHFFGVRGTFENVCFSIVKPYFLTFGRVWDGVFFVLCFWIDTFGILSVVF